MAKALGAETLAADSPQVVIVSGDPSNEARTRASLPGVPLRFASSVDDACEWLARAESGLAIISAEDHRQGGFVAALKRLRAIDPPVLVVVLDSSRNPAVMQIAFDLGVDFYQEDDLIAAVIDSAVTSAQGGPHAVIHEVESGSAAGLLYRGFFSLAFQPVWDLKDDSCIGYESLFRGPRDTELANPQEVFHSRSTLDKDTLARLELASISAALRVSSDLPDGEILFVNACDETFTRTHGNVVALQLLIERYAPPGRRIVLEISEDADPLRIDRLAAALRPLRGMGMGIALDDVGASNSWLHLVLRLEPEYIKLDRGLVSGINGDPKKQLLLQSLSELANRMGADVIVEGVETEEELATVKELGVRYAQGFLLGRPAAADHWYDRSES